MNFKKFFQKIFAVMIFIFVMQIFSSAQAASKIFEGVGYFPVINETLDHAKEKAKLDGARNICEQIFVEIQSNVETKKSVLQRDEVFKVTEGLLKILEVKYKILADDEDENNFIVRADVTASIDIEEVEKFLSELRRK